MFKCLLLSMKTCTINLFKGPFLQGCVITGYKMSETDVLSQGNFEKLNSFMWNFYSQQPKRFYGASTSNCVQTYGCTDTKCLCGDKNVRLFTSGSRCPQYANCVRTTSIVTHEYINSCTSRNFEVNIGK